MVSQKENDNSLETELNKPMEYCSVTDKEFKNSVNYKKTRSSRPDAAVTNPTRSHEVAGLIPGLSQWVKDLELS